MRIFKHEKICRVLCVAATVTFIGGIAPVFAAAEGQDKETSVTEIDNSASRKGDVSSSFDSKADNSQQGTGDRKAARAEIPNDVSSKIYEAEKNANDAAEKSMYAMVGSSAAVAMALVAIIVAASAKISARRGAEKIQKLHEENVALRRKLVQHEHSSSAKPQASARTGAGGSSEMSTAADIMRRGNDVMDARRRQAQQQIRPTEPAAQAPHREPTLEELAASLVNNYNEIAGEIASGTATGVLRSRKKEFHSRYVGFSCMNVNERMSNSDIKPDFSDMPSDEGTFVAMLIPGRQDIYGVVPQLNTVYDLIMHNVGGMKEAFTSNFDKSVGHYDRVIVVKPAIFHRQSNGSWMIMQQGILRLG